MRRRTAALGAAIGAAAVGNAIQVKSPSTEPVTTKNAETPQGTNNAVKLAVSSSGRGSTASKKTMSVSTAASKNSIVKTSKDIITDHQTTTSSAHQRAVVSVSAERADEDQKSIKDAVPTEFPTAKPDKVDPNGDADLVTDAKTHDEEHRYEASAHASPPAVHKQEQEALDDAGYRPGPSLPKPFIDATCEEICASDCATQGIGAELDSTYEEVTNGIPMPQVVKDFFGPIGDYFKDVGKAIVPGVNLGQKVSDPTDKKKKASTPEESVDKKISLHKGSSTFATDVAGKKAANKDTNCAAACQAQVDHCFDEIDSSDSVPEDVEEFTTRPHISHCQDLAKLHFIAESGNLKWSLRFGQSPTFGQLAALAEPYDLITDSDLKVLSHCTEGGDFASINLGAAIGLAKCMVGEVHTYADSIGDSILSVHAKDTEDKLEDPEMNPIAVDPVVSDEKGEFHMSEEVFYINDVRCFSGCVGLKVHGVMEMCAQHGHCASDYADLLWRAGFLYAPTTMGNAINDMGHAHATDPAAVPASLAEHFKAIVAKKRSLLAKSKKEDPALPPGEITPGTVDPREARREAKEAVENAPPPAEYIPPEDDPTSTAYNPPGEETPAAPFCKMQMCAPYPSTWVTGDLLKQLFRMGTLEKCPAAAAVPDVHPREMYDGALKSEPGSVPPSLIQKGSPEHPADDAREKAIERRQKNWGEAALKATGFHKEGTIDAKRKEKESKK